MDETLTGSIPTGAFGRKTLLISQVTFWQGQPTEVRYRSQIEEMPATDLFSQPTTG